MGVVAKSQRLSRAFASQAELWHQAALENEVLHMLGAEKDSRSVCL